MRKVTYVDGFSQIGSPIMAYFDLCSSYIPELVMLLSYLK